jgi:hypothetical protein
MGVSTGDASLVFMLVYLSQSSMSRTQFFPALSFASISAHSQPKELITAPPVMTTRFFIILSITPSPR